MKVQQGFTLIELVVVIVILGILAATAIPKFIDMSVEAGDAAALATAGAIASGSSINYAKFKANSAGLSATGVVNLSAGQNCSNAPSLLTGNAMPNADLTMTGTTLTCTNGVSTSCGVKHAKGTAAGVSATIVCTQ